MFRVIFKLVHFAIEHLASGTRNVSKSPTVKGPEMKTLALVIPLAVAMALPLKAQQFQPNIARDSLFGAIAGAVIGHQSGHLAEGALLGAGAGAVISSVADRGEINAPVAGAVIGGVAGAAIGNNNGGHTAEGAIIGSIIGLGIGAIAESSQNDAPSYNNSSNRWLIGRRRHCA